ncbi:MAG: adenosine deaminase, partial [Lachnospiraceae bacterium]|nr:adenosine deaminase [Lachnospiraceae bacterium]
MNWLNRFYLDKEKDMIVDLYQDGEELSYVLRTPNHGTGNLITNLAKLCGLPLSEDERGLRVIRGRVPCYIDGYNRRLYIFRLGGTKVANIFPDGTIEMKAQVPAISKTLMSQTKDYRLSIEKTIVKTYLLQECKFRTDLHTHMNANLSPDVLIALGIVHQIRYPLYYIKKLGLRLTSRQEEVLAERRRAAEEACADCGLTGKYLVRRIDDNTFLNFADLIINNFNDATYNIPRIRASLSIMKDGQAVFADLEKVYLYRYVFTKGKLSEERFSGISTGGIPDPEVRSYAERMRRDREDG